MEAQKIGNGSLSLQLKAGKFYTIWGGPYRDIPQNFRNVFGVKLAPEIREMTADLELPIRDFSVPTKEQVDKVLPELVRVMISGEPVYIGCMGGRGRTGLALALIAKAFGVENPVEYVREHYFAHAVETREQYQFVQGYTIPAEVEWMLSKARSRWNWRTWFKTSLTDPMVE